MTKQNIQMLLSMEYKNQVTRLQVALDNIGLYTKPEEGRIEVAAQVDASIWKMGAVVTTNSCYVMTKLVEELQCEDITLYEEVENDVLSTMMKSRLRKAFYILYMSLTEADF